MAIQVKEKTYWVGVQDWNLREFHGPTFHVPNGTTYNAYLILDEQITLIDIVEHDFFDLFYEKVVSLIGDKPIHNLIINHTEPDHSSSFKKLLEKYPDINVYCSKKGAEFMDKQYGIEYGKYNIVGSGNKLSIGKNVLSFIDMKMLHWPDSIATYMEEEKILFSNDAFGQHVVSTKVFDEAHRLDTVLYEAKKYYANIIMPMAGILSKKMEEITRMNLEIDIIAPSHGIIWRKYVNEILEKYFEWSTWKTKEKVVIAYDTMWGNTEKMAFALAKGFQNANMQVKLYKVSKSDVNEIMTDIVDARAVLIGSSTIYGGMIANIAYLLEEIRVLKPNEKVGFAFGSNGWAKGAVPRIESMLLEVGFKLFNDGVNTNFLPTKEEIEKLESIAFEMSRSIRNDINGEREIYIEICEKCHAKEFITLRDLAYNGGYVLHVKYACLFHCGSETIFCKYNEEIIGASDVESLWKTILEKHAIVLKQGY
ncbi:MAG: FprA family A-type flavoprotein [Bacilli bacterium]